MTMPADERATLTNWVDAFRLQAAQERASGRHFYADMFDKAVEALKEADRRAREDAARIAERHVPSSPSAAGEYAMRRNGEDIAAAIRASITTAEG